LLQASGFLARLVDAFGASACASALSGVLSDTLSNERLRDLVA